MVVMVGVATIIGYVFRSFRFPETNIVVVYILSVILTARLTDGYAYGIAATVLSTCAFNIFFTSPYYTLSVDDPTYLITFSILEDHPLPSDIVALGEEGILKIWREHKVRGAGKTRARKLYEAAERSVGRTEAPYVARMEFRTIMEDIKRYQQRLDEIEQAVDQILPTVKNAEKLLEIPGVGKATVVTFLAEVGDISRFRSAKEIQKLAGLAIVTNESCKHKGATCISYRGRKRLRWILYEAALSLVGRNKEFNQIHQYYTTREKNPLKGIQSVVAVACKVIRIFYKILTTGVSYDGTKMTMDIVRA